MNFLLMRSNQTATAEQPPAQKIQAETSYAAKLTSTLGGLFAEDPLLPRKSFDHDGEGDGHGNENGVIAGLIGKGNHIEVAEGEGWIAIPKSNVLLLYPCHLDSCLTYYIDDIIHKDVSMPFSPLIFFSML